MRYAVSLSRLLAIVVMPIALNQMVVVGLTREGKIWPTDVEFARLMQGYATPDVRVVALYKVEPSMLIHVKRPVPLVLESAEMEKILDSENPTIVLAWRYNLEQLASQMNDPNHQHLLNDFISFKKFALTFNQSYLDAYEYGNRKVKE